MQSLTRGGLFSWGKLLQSAQDGNAVGTAVDCMTQGLGAMGTLVVNVIGSTFTGTVNFEGTVDGTNWFAISGTNLATGAAAATVTATALFRFDVRGLLKFRARTSSVTGGTVTVTYTLTP